MISCASTVVVDLTERDARAHDDLHGEIENPSNAGMEDPTAVIDINKLREERPPKEEKTKTAVPIKIEPTDAHKDRKREASDRAGTPKKSK